MTGGRLSRIMPCEALRNIVLPLSDAMECQWTPAHPRLRSLVAKDFEEDCALAAIVCSDALVLSRKHLQSTVKSSRAAIHQGVDSQTSTLPHNLFSCFPPSMTYLQNLRKQQSLLLSRPPCMVCRTGLCT